MIAVLLMLSAANAQEVDGFTELRAQAMVGVDSPFPVTFVERFRPRVRMKLHERARFVGVAEVGALQGWIGAQELRQVIDGQGLEFEPPSDDASSPIGALRVDFERNHFIGYATIDRAFVEINLSAVDLKIGRQALNWGSGYGVNPSDPFPEVLVTEPWRPRAGVHAVRGDIPFGDLSGMTLIAGVDDRFRHPRLAMRTTVNRWGTDFSVVGAWRPEASEGVVGVDVKGTAFVGYWVEGVVRVKEGGEVAEEVVLGVDYSFPILESLLLSAQYYRNGLGEPQPGLLALTAEREPFAPPFSGRDYLLVTGTLGISPSWSVSTLWLQQLGDGSAFSVSSVSWSASQRWDVSLSAQVPVALNGAGEFKPFLGDSPFAEFAAAVPDATVILWTRYNF